MGSRAQQLFAQQGADIACLIVEHVLEGIMPIADKIVVLVDGEPKQLAAVKVEARRAGVKVTILADVVHVLEYIWKAARALFGESSPEAEAWVRDRLLALLTGRSGGQVAHTIRWWASRRELDDAARESIDTACNYLADQTRTRLMHYAEALRDGLPIATGAPTSRMAGRSLCPSPTTITRSSGIP